MPSVLQSTSQSVICRFRKGRRSATRPLTKEDWKALPRLGSQANVEDPVAKVKFFTPDSNWTWYVIEFDGQDQFFGLVEGFELEMGYFSPSEIKEARGQLGLPIECGLYFKPMRVSEIRRRIAGGRRP